MGGKPNKPHTIYAIQCEPNQRVYVGCTANFESRIYSHFADLRRGDKIRVKKGQRDKSLWQKDYDEYGRNAFKVYILEENVPPEDARIVERHWIDKYDATNPKYGYNQPIYPHNSSPEYLFTVTEGKPTNPSKQ